MNPPQVAPQPTSVEGSMAELVHSPGGMPLHDTIVEAVLNFVTTPIQLDDALRIIEKDLGPSIAPTYPLIKKLFAPASHNPTGINVAPLSQQAQIGFLFTSADGKCLVQVRADGIALSRLRPYRGWEQLRDELLRLFALYQQHLAAHAITTVGTRYLNHMPIPESASMEKYLTCYPQVGASFPQVLVNYGYRVVLPLDQNLNLVTISIAPAVPEKRGWANILLDLDFSVRRDEAIELFDQLEHIRRAKDQVYLDAMTDEMKQVLNAGSHL